MPSGGTPGCRVTRILAMEIQKLSTNMSVSTTLSDDCRLMYFKLN